MSAGPDRTHLSVALLGQVDGGKSTILGHLRYLSGCVSQREMDKVAEEAAELGRHSFKFAWLSDNRKHERERGITVEPKATQLLTSAYALSIMDTPGHVSFTRHTIAGMASADHVVLVVDAQSGAYEVGMGMGERSATKEHALNAFAMGAKQLIVAVNKMDALVTPYDQARFDDITREVGAYLARLGFKDENVQFVPVSGWTGDNLVTRASERMPWYDGVTLLKAFDRLMPPPRYTDRPLRLTVQGAYHIRDIGLVVMGHVETGVLKRGMQLSFGPTKGKGTVFSIECHQCAVKEAPAGMSVGVNIKGLTKDDIKRGYVASDVNCDEALPATRFTAQLVFLKHPASMGVQVGYAPIVHCHKTQVACSIAKITNKLDRATGKVLARPTEEADADERVKVRSGEACELVFQPTSAMVVEAFREYPSLSRLVVREAGATIAIGIVRSVEKQGAPRP